MQAVEVVQNESSCLQIRCIKVEQMQGVGDQNVQTFLNQEEVGEIEGVGVVVELEELHLGVVVIQETEETAISALIRIMLCIEMSAQTGEGIV
jgi:hypothetical protein